MREIKFRAWNKKLNFMDSAWLLDFEHELVCHSKHNQSDMEDCVLMQYTGLKDKNGAEIYENDIVKGVDFKLRVEFVCQAKWHEKGYWYAFNKEGRGIGFLNSIELLEVIGNIHEHSHLLEGELNES